MADVPEVLTPQSNPEGQEPLAGLNYVGALEQRWGIVTPFHKRNVGFTDKTTKDQLTMVRLYVDPPEGMARRDLENIPVPEALSPLRTLLALGQPFQLFLTSEISYQRTEKLQPQLVHEDEAVYFTSGEGLKPINIPLQVFNTPTDPWARYMELMWEHFLRASKLAKYKLQLRLHFFDRALFIIPQNINFAYRASSQDIASVQIAGFLRRSLYVPPPGSSAAQVEMTESIQSLGIKSELDSRTLSATVTLE